MIRMMIVVKDNDQESSEAKVKDSTLVSSSLQIGQGSKTGED
jgi:hypothetical protein